MTALPRDTALVPATLLMLVLLALMLPLLALDTRMLDGHGVWVKPTKFAAALALHFATLAVFARRMSPGARGGRVLRGTAILAAFCGGAEMVYIMVMAGAQAPSHWNFSTPLTTAMYQAMGVGAVVLTAAAGVLGVLIARDPAARLSPGLRRGAILGLTLGTLLTLGIAGYLGGADGHHVGLHPPGGAEVPLTGWSLEVGDLRPAHFLALHAMQLIPLLGLALDRLAPRFAVTGVTVGAAVHVALTLAVFAQARAGLPIF